MTICPGRSLSTLTLATTGTLHADDDRVSWGRDGLSQSCLAKAITASLMICLRVASGWMVF